MEANVPVRFPGVQSQRTEILAQWYDGKIAVYEGDDVLGWKADVLDLGEQLETRVEVKVDSVNGLGFARANSGFPIEMHPFSVEAREWASGQLKWKEQHGMWTELFHGNGRGIC